MEFSQLDDALIIGVLLRLETSSVVTFSAAGKAVYKLCADNQALQPLRAHESTGYVRCTAGLA